MTNDDRPLRVVGNLPYNISTPLIFKLLDNTTLIRDMHFMLQREAVLRLAAEPGKKDWGRLGVMAPTASNSHLFDVPREAFFPAPKVQSAIVRLLPHSSIPFPIATSPNWAGWCRWLAQRRKTCATTSKALGDSDLIVAALTGCPGRDPAYAAFVALSALVDTHEAQANAIKIVSGHLVAGQGGNTHDDLCLATYRAASRRSKPCAGKWTSSPNDLWAVGDLINRGPDNLRTLRWFFRHRDAVTVVLGNHDLHLLAHYEGVGEAARTTFRMCWRPPMPASC